MYRKLAALMLAAALLCSCSARVTVQRYPAELPRAESPAATPTPEPVPTFTEEQKSYGSAALLTDATVLVNVFLNDAAHGHTWDAESRAAAVQRTQLAIDWITEQAAGYEAAVNLICDRSADGRDSTLTRSYLVQSAMQGGENSEESSAFLDEMGYAVRVAGRRQPSGCLRGPAHRVFVLPAHQRDILHDASLRRRRRQLLL